MISSTHYDFYFERNDKNRNTYLAESISITLRYKFFFWNTQMMSMTIFYVFVATESESDICFASSRLDLAVPKLWIFAFLLKSEKKIWAQVI